jgi:hypothetical protein
MPDPRPDETEDEFVSRCVPVVLEDGTAEDGAQASAICHSMFREAKKMVNGRGLYLADPHGKLIWNGKKSFIAKAKEVEIEGDWHIVSKNKAYGRATMGESQPVESSEFDELFDAHRITHKERSKWWGEKAPLYLYEIKSFEKYDPPLKVVVPDGVQFVIDAVEFVDPFPEGVKESLGSVTQIDNAETEAIPSGGVDLSSTDKEVEVVEEKAGRRIRTSKVNVLKELKKKIDAIMKELGALIGFADYADKQPFYDLLNKESGFKTFKNKKDDKTWILTWTTNSFIDREEEIFSQKSIEDYVERHFEDDVKGEFQFWHMPGSKYGDILWQGVSGRFLVEAGPFDDTPIGQAFEKVFNENPDGHPIVAPEGWGTSHKYYFKLEDREDGVYDWFDKEETTVLPMSAASNPHSPKMEVLQVEQKQVDALTHLGIDDELVKDIVETGDEETKTLEDAGVARKEVESEEKEVVAEVSDESEEVLVETIEVEAEIPAEKVEEEGEKEEVDEPEFVTLEEVKEGFGALASAIKELMGKIDSIETSVKSLERTDDEKFEEKVELTPKASLKDHVESVIGKDETKVDGRTELAKDGPEEAKSAVESRTGIPLLDNIQNRNEDHIGTKLQGLE